MSKLEWVDHPKISLGTYNGEYAAVVQIGSGPRWSTLYSVYPSGTLYDSRDEAKAAAEQRVKK